jgi:hypothetical protein
MFVVPVLVLGIIVTWTIASSTSRYFISNRLLLPVCEILTVYPSTPQPGMGMTVLGLFFLCVWQRYFRN